MIDAGLGMSISPSVQTWTLRSDSTTDTKVEFKSITPEQTIPLRHTVLWPDHPISHVLLPEDDTGLHFGAFVASSDVPIAVISIFKETLPNTHDLAPTARFRKFACDPSFQGRGIGTKLLKHVCAVTAGELGCQVLWCDARLATAEWYERRGMTRFGEVFYKGDIPYVRMQTVLGS